MTTSGAVLVTGGCGFIGHHLVQRLLGSGRRVIVVDDISTGALENLPAHPALTVVTASILDDDAWRAAGEVDRVYHLAGVVGMRLATREREHAYRVAVEGTERTLAATGDAPIVLFSSSAVYGRRHAAHASESTVLEERDTLDYDGGQPGYATGKLRLEQFGLTAAAQGRRVLIVRPFNVIGARQSAAYGMVLPTFLDRAFAGHPLEVHDDGLQTRAFSDIDVFLETLERLVDEPAAWDTPEPIYNLGTTDATSIIDLARHVVEAAGGASAIDFTPYASAFPGRTDVRARVPDSGRLDALLGPVAWPSCQDIVRRLCNQRRARAG